MQGSPGRSGLSAPRAAGVRSVALIAAEVIGYLSMWSVIPLGWMWVGARVFEITGSLALDLLVAFGGFLVSMGFTASALTRIDEAWVELRRRAGYDQRQGALTQVVVVTTTIAFAAFWVWFHILSDAFIIPFMPLN